MTGPGHPSPDEPGRPNADDDFARSAGALLRASAEQLDGATRSRLSQARRRALAARGPGSRLGSWRWSPAMAAAAVALVAVALWMNLRPMAPEAPALPAPEPAVDLELILTDAPPEMVAELEFYAWLDPALEDPAAEPGPGG